MPNVPYPNHPDRPAVDLRLQQPRKPDVLDPAQASNDYHARLPTDAVRDRVGALLIHP